MDRVKGLIALSVVLAVALVFPVAVPTSAPVNAQTDQINCKQLFEQALVDMMANCFSTQANTVCGASGDVTITMASGQMANGAGTSARVSGVKSVTLGDAGGSAWSLASLNLPDMFDNRKTTTMLVFGPAELAFNAAAGLTEGASFSLTTGNAPLCSDLPYPGVLVQTPESSLAQLRINDTDVMVNGMALISTRTGGTLQVNSLTKETILGQSGTVVFAGYTVSAIGEYAGEVAPYNVGQVQNLPVQILPVMQRIALPGNATVREAMNLFSQPGAEYYTGVMITKGLPVNVFGQDSSGDWYHVRTYAGDEGWMPAYVLDSHVAVALPVYDQLPGDLVRPFGSVQGYIKTNYEFNNLRAGPGDSFDIVVTVPLWTDLALYGRSPDGEWLLVETLDGERAWLNVALVSTSTPFVLNELPLAPEFTS